MVERLLVTNTIIVVIEDTVLTAIPKVRQDLVKVMGNGMDRQMEVY
jgi:hypothetical protein